MFIPMTSPPDIDMRSTSPMNDVKYSPDVNPIDAPGVADIDTEDDIVIISDVDDDAATSDGSAHDETSGDGKIPKETSDMSIPMTPAPDVMLSPTNDITSHVPSTIPMNDVKYSPDVNPIDAPEVADIDTEDNVIIISDVDDDAATSDGSAHDETSGDGKIPKETSDITKPITCQPDDELTSHVRSTSPMNDVKYPQDVNHIDAAVVTNIDAEDGIVIISDVDDDTATSDSSV